MSILLEIKNVALSVAQRILYRDLNINIMPGQVWGILGPNGSGKTTLLHTLAGLHKTTGEIKLHGKQIQSLAKKDFAKQVALLTQETRDTFPLTVYELCSLGRYPHSNPFSLLSSYDKKIISKALNEMELLELSQQKIQTLSGGERRRLSIATVLAQTPQLYLLDEPTNHLDLYYQYKILQHFKKLANVTKISVIMSLHDINLAAHFCDNILMLGHQQDFLAGPTHNLLNENNLSKLYQFPIKKIIQNNFHAWFPIFENESDS